MSLIDMEEVESQLDEVVDCFEDKLKQLFDEVPEAFEGRSNQMDWFAQVSAAGDVLREELNDVIEKVEARLHGGEFA